MWKCQELTPSTHGHQEMVAEKIAPAVRETPGQKLRREMVHRRQQQHSQRRSGGIHI